MILYITKGYCCISGWNDSVMLCWAGKRLVTNRDVVRPCPFDREWAHTYAHSLAYNPHMHTPAHIHMQKREGNGKWKYCSFNTHSASASSFSSLVFPFLSVSDPEILSPSFLPLILIMSNCSVSTWAPQTSQWVIKCARAWGKGLLYCQCRKGP